MNLKDKLEQVQKSIEQNQRQAEHHQRQVLLLQGYAACITEQLREETPEKEVVDERSG